MQINYQSIMASHLFQRIAGGLDPDEVYGPEIGFLLHTTLTKSESDTNELFSFLAEATKTICTRDLKVEDNFYCGLKTRVSKIAPPTTDEKTIIHLMKGCLLTHAWKAKQKWRELFHKRIGNKGKFELIIDILRSFPSFIEFNSTFDRNYRKAIRLIGPCEIRVTQQQSPNHRRRDATILTSIVVMTSLFALKSSNFAIGLGLGALKNCCNNLIINRLSDRIFHDLDDADDGEKEIYETGNIPTITLLAPIGEELVFRGMLQPLLAKAVQLAIPSTSAILFGKEISRAQAIAVLSIGVLFGWLHRDNPTCSGLPSYSRISIISVGGIIYGATAAKYGLMASIASHLFNNTVACISHFCRSSNSNDESQSESSADSDSESLVSPKGN